MNDGRFQGDGNLYFKHHIFPRSIYPAWKHKDWNIVLLTQVEHKQAHYYLSKITVGECKTVMTRVYTQYFGGEDLKD